MTETDHEASDTESDFWVYAEENPTKLAVVDPDGTNTSYGQLRDEVHRIANALQGAGLKRGDTFAVVLPNCSATLAIYFAALETGLYYTPINFHLTPSEIAFIVSDCEAKLLIVDERFGDASQEAITASSISSDLRFALGTVRGFTAFEKLVDGQSISPPSERSAGQRMLYTSGTTGKPKGVKRPLPTGTVDSMADAAVQQALMFEITPGQGSHLLVGPMYHGAPLMFASTALHMGHSVVVMDKWTPERTLDLIEQQSITTSHMVPTMFHRLLALPETRRKSCDISSLQNVLHAAAPCPVDVKRKMMEWWGPILYEYYGATETGTISFVRPNDWLAHPGTVGQPPAGVEIKVLDDEEREVPAGTPGDLCVLTSQGRTFEYFKDPEKTKAARRGEMVLVPDIGYRDEDGWLYLCDRKSEVIVSGGVNIYPAEIEAILLQHPKVGDAAVVSVPSDEWGEEVKAVIEVNGGVAADADLAHELIAFCRDRLAGFKCPRSVDFRSELPRYTSGKLYRRRIRDEYWQQSDRKI